ncbi:erythromycin esterase family protein [Streptomyces puniciscabiei]|uniref:erythromycin esterase family protein n=1 Tax=Streptomyces puniciscabiei TaxID=164348 RepID=UPI00378AAA02
MIERRAYSVHGPDRSARHRQRRRRAAQNPRPGPGPVARRVGDRSPANRVLPAQTPATALPHREDGVREAAGALAGLGFWTWRTREMLDGVEWPRAHNRTVRRERAGRFVGIDPQRCGPPWRRRPPCSARWHRNGRISPPAR